MASLKQSLSSNKTRKELWCCVPCKKISFDDFFSNRAVFAQFTSRKCVTAFPLSYLLSDVDIPLNSYYAGTLQE